MSRRKKWRLIEKAIEFRMTIEEQIESMKFRLEKLELDMSNLKRLNFEVKEEIKEQVKRSQRDMDQVEKLAGG